VYTVGKTVGKSYSGSKMARFFVYFLTFAACLTVAVLIMFKMSCWWGVLALILCLFLAERAGLLR